MLFSSLASFTLATFILVLVLFKVDLAASLSQQPQRNAGTMAKYTRPGVEAAVRLASMRPASDHLSKWERAVSEYSSMLKSKGGTKLQKLEKEKQEIATLWCQQEDQSSSFLTKEQLLDVVVEWKFLKGKPRNALRPMLRSNSPELIQTSCRNAFEKAATSLELDEVDIPGAISALCEPRGVGPATASAVLAMYRPDVFAFMDDEVIECLYAGKRGYTAKIYLEVNAECATLADELEQERRRRRAATKKEKVEEEEGGDDKWTPYRVGKALWTMAKLSADGKDLAFVFDGDEDVQIEGYDVELETRKSAMLKKRKNASHEEQDQSSDNNNAKSSSTRVLRKRRK